MPGRMGSCAAHYGTDCQWASKMSGLWALKMSGSERCPAERAERPERGSGPGAERPRHGPAPEIRFVQILHEGVRDCADPSARRGRIARGGASSTPHHQIGRESSNVAGDVDVLGQNRRIAVQSFDTDVPPLNIRCRSNGASKTARRVAITPGVLPEEAGAVPGAPRRCPQDIACLLRRKPTGTALQPWARRLQGGLAIQDGMTVLAARTSLRCRGFGKHGVKLFPTSLGPSHATARMTVPALRFGAAGCQPGACSNSTR